MNDRSQAGTAFRDGRIELMFDRRIHTSDSLGNPERLDEINSCRGPMRSNNKYYLKFTPNRKEAFKAISQRTMKTLNPL